MLEQPASEVASLQASLCPSPSPPKRCRTWWPNMRRASWSGVAQSRPFWCRWFPNRGSRNGDTWSGGLKTNSSDAPDFHDFRSRDPCDFTGCGAYGLFGKEMERKRTNFIQFSESTSLSEHKFRFWDVFWLLASGNCNANQHLATLKLLP